MTDQRDEQSNSDEIEASDKGEPTSQTLERLKSDFTAPKIRHPMETILKNGAVFLPKQGDLVKGEFLTKKGTQVFVDLGPIGTGIIYGREYYAAQDIIKGMGAGDEIHAKVVELDNEDGYIELSLKEAGEEKKWIDVKKIMQDGKVLELPVKEANRGGLILEIQGIQGFLPASQLSYKNYPRVDGGDKEKIYQELQKIIGNVIKVKIIDVDPKENKLIFSEKESESDDLKARIAKYKIGDEVEGEITGVLDFGAFMKFDEGLEGLIHISEIEWSLVENPRSVLKIGDKLKAKIIDIHGGKVSLSLKQLKQDPWLKVAEKYHKGDAVSGKVTKFNPFGAFVELEESIQGLVHISEFGRETNMKNELELEKNYDFRVLMVDPREHRLSLGMIRDNKEKEAVIEEKQPSETNQSQ